MKKSTVAEVQVKLCEACIICGSKQVTKIKETVLGGLPFGLCERHQHYIVGWHFGPQAFENGAIVVFPPGRFREECKWM